MDPVSVAIICITVTAVTLRDAPSDIACAVRGEPSPRAKRRAARDERKQEKLRIQVERVKLAQEQQRLKQERRQRRQQKREEKAAREPGVFRTWMVELWRDTAQRMIEEQEQHRVDAERRRRGELPLTPWQRLKDHASVAARTKWDQGCTWLDAKLFDSGSTRKPKPEPEPSHDPEPAVPDEDVDNTLNETHDEARQEPEPEHPASVDDAGPATVVVDGELIPVAQSPGSEGEENNPNEPDTHFDGTDLASQTPTTDPPSPMPAVVAVPAKPETFTGTEGDSMPQPGRELAKVRNRPQRGSGKPGAIRAAEVATYQDAIQLGSDLAVYAKRGGNAVTSLLQTLIRSDAKNSEVAQLSKDIAQIMTSDLLPKIQRLNSALTKWEGLQTEYSQNPNAPGKDMFKG